MNGVIGVNGCVNGVNAVICTKYIWRRGNRRARADFRTPRTPRTVRTVRAPYVPMRGENGGRTCQFYWEMKPVGPMHIHTVEGMKGMDRHHFLREWTGVASTLSHSPRLGAAAAEVCTSYAYVAPSTKATCTGLFTGKSQRKMDMIKSS